MSVMEVSKLDFSYPDGNKILHAIDFEIDAGEFCIMSGASGCGKTTLLRCMKKQLTPAGNMRGSITELPPQDIGFVFQNPENQIVTDTVRHELAFGLENMGIPTNVIRMRVAETALFFGIDEWIDASVHEISGGQKQLLNLAAVIAMRPRLLLLDEPVSQLDPIARKNFLDILARVNRELGIAVLLCEHHLEELLSLADRSFFMENGRIAYDGDVAGFVRYILWKDSGFAGALPASVRIAEAFDKGQRGYPLTVKEGRDYLKRTESPAEDRFGEIMRRFCPDRVESKEHETALMADCIWFQYRKQEPFVLKGLRLILRAKECHMILGGNGSGKTTLLSILGKRLYADRGKIRLGAGHKMPRIALLLQNPKAMFSHDTVAEELYAAEVPEYLIDRLELRSLMSLHPYDISGGEQQRLGLALSTAKEPDLLLLDEPTKGLDAAMKEELGAFLKEYVQKGATVVCVTHDVEFAAKFADVCSLLFEGEILATEPAALFFQHNAFYTTDARRIFRGFSE